MRTITISILNEKAIKLLQDLEASNLIKMIAQHTIPEKVPSTKKKASQYKGSISPELAEKMQDYVKQSRQEWQHRI